MPDRRTGCRIGSVSNAILKSTRRSVQRAPALWIDNRHKPKFIAKTTLLPGFNRDARGVNQVLRLINRTP